MGVLEDILEWSAHRPMWQRDALRRIVERGEVEENDVLELFAICLNDRGFADDMPWVPSPNPLTEEHLPEPHRAVKRVQLAGLSGIEGVNALAPGQHINFQLGGMTIVFGYNGSGKSGYARILRSLCRARSRGSHILPNAFAGDTQTEPCAIIHYRVDGADFSESWQQGRSGPQELQRVSFFDTNCAAVYVDDTNELAFTPLGLDILPKLASACQRLNALISERIAQRESEQPPSLVNPEAAEGTRARSLLDGLNEGSDMDAFRQAARLSEGEHRRLQQLQGALSTDPVQRAREIRNSLTRLYELRKHTSNVYEILSADAMAALQAQLNDSKTKAEAAQVAAQEAFGGQPLPGVGEETWRQLWQAARQYSEQHPYPDHSFPYTDEEARCVLCQQRLGPEARDRLKSFDAFVKGATRQAADKAAGDLETAMSKVRQITTGLAAYSEALRDLPQDDHEEQKAVRRFHRIAWRVRRAALEIGQRGEWRDISWLTSSPLPQLDTLIERLSSRVEELNRAARADERSKLQDECHDLAARKWLGQVLPDIEAEIKRRKTLAALRLAERDTNTTGITVTNRNLTDKYITKVLQNTFIDECRDLGGGHLRIALDTPAAQYGRQQFKISLVGARADIAVRDVLSEGEFRCIALAGFLAELSTEQSESAIVLDDPVSSLDHQWRRRVAERLAQEAKTRQVIVFTHEVSFLVDLMGACTAKDVETRHAYVQRTPAYSGEYLDDAPWPVMTIKRRIGRLKTLHQAAEAINRKQGSAVYEPQARRIYSLLRASWERGVEELLINGAVMRFDRDVHTQKLSRLADISEEDIKPIEAGMTKCSRFTDAHDEAGVLLDPVPEPDELMRDIGELEQWVARMRSRRN